MTKRLEKHYGNFKKEEFLQAIRDDYDNKLITFGDQDYMFDLVYNKIKESSQWYLMDALEFMTEKKPRPLAGPFKSIDELLNAPVLAGKSITERYGELKTCDFVSVVDQ